MFFLQREFDSVLESTNFWERHQIEECSFNDGRLIRSVHFRNSPAERHRPNLFLERVINGTIGLSVPSRVGNSHLRNCDSFRPKWHDDLRINRIKCTPNDLESGIGLRSLYGL